MKIQRCRICNSSKFLRLLDLGNMPMVNSFLDAEDLRKKEPKFPLRLCVCADCRLVQLTHRVPAQKLFRNYHYLTSASQPLIDHFRSLAQECVDLHAAKGPLKVLDIGANDGTLLYEFHKLGARTLGIDPSTNACMAAKQVGIEVINDFFSKGTARRELKKLGPFDIVTGTNVFAHTHRIRDFLEGVKTLLAPNGMLILEFANLTEMIMKVQFDVIYHEHLSYFSLSVLRPFFRALGLEIFDSKRVLTQGGSLRIYARRLRGKPVKPSPEMAAILQEERDDHIDEIATLRRFAKEVRQFRSDFRKLILDVSRRGKKIVAFGAPAKGIILLNYAGLNSRHFAYAVDSTPLKQGRFMPGTHIPVFSERKLEDDPGNYILILSWNFQDAILKKIAALGLKNVRTIIPFPKLRILE